MNTMTARGLSLAVVVAVWTAISHTQNLPLSLWPVLVRLGGFLRSAAGRGPEPRDGGARRPARARGVLRHGSLPHPQTVRRQADEYHDRPRVELSSGGGCLDGDLPHAEPAPVLVAGARRPGVLPRRRRRDPRAPEVPGGRGLRRGVGVGVRRGVSRARTAGYRGRARARRRRG